MSRRRPLTDLEKDDLSLQVVSQIIESHRSKLKKNDLKFLSDFYVTYFPIFMTCRQSFLRRCIFLDHQLSYFVTFCLFIRRGTLRGIRVSGIDKSSLLPLFESFDTQVKFFKGDTYWVMSNIKDWCPDVYPGVTEISGSLLSYDKPVKYKSKE